MVNLNSIIGNSLRTALLSIASFGSIGLGLANSQESNYSSDSINNLNKLFRQQYVEARNSQLIGVGPVIIVRSDNLVLLRDEKRFVGAAVHPNYHDLKALAHCPLSLFCILENTLDLSNHSARLLTRELVRSADLILVMSGHHLARVAELGGEEKVQLLGAYAGREEGHTEVSDPYGSDLASYRATFLELQELIGTVVSRVAGTVR